MGSGTILGPACAWLWYIPCNALCSLPRKPRVLLFFFSNFAEPFLPLGLLSNGEGHSTTEITKNTVGMYWTVNLHIITEEGSPCSVLGVWMNFSKTVDPSHLMNLTSNLLYSFLPNVKQSSLLSECLYFLLAWHWPDSLQTIILVLLCQSLWPFSWIDLHYKEFFSYLIIPFDESWMLNSTTLKIPLATQTCDFAPLTQSPYPNL